MDAWDNGEMGEQSDRQIGGWTRGCLEHGWRVGGMTRERTT